MKRFLRNWVIPPGYVEVVSQARQYMRNRAKNKLNSEDRRLLEENRILKNKHQGKRCFIFGAGSSIQNQDLTKLLGEQVISVSNTFVHPEFHLFRPAYHILPPIMSSHRTIHSESDWFLWLKEMEEKTHDAALFLHIGDKKLIEDNNLFRGRTIHWVDYYKWDEARLITNIDLARLPSIKSVSETAISVALYLGFEKIYLLGFDHDWFNGPLVYFYDEKTEHAMKPNAEKLAFADSEFQMRRHAWIFRKYKMLYALKKNIFNANANPKHYLDVFPKVDFDSLFSEKN